MAEVLDKLINGEDNLNCDDDLSTNEDSNEMSENVGSVGIFSPYVIDHTNPLTPDFRDTTNPYSPDFRDTTNPYSPDYIDSTNPLSTDYIDSNNPFSTDFINE